MAVTNVKSTWLAKLLGQTNDKKNLPEEGMSIGNPNAGMNPGLRFQNESPLFGPQGIGAAPQPQAPQQAPRSRYNLYEMTQPRPTRDTESEEIIKRRAKVNALGAGISGLAGLASMATGGDVAQPVDLVTPWNMDQTRMLDQDYRGRLQNWIDQGFQVDQANTQLQNREIEQDFDADNRMAQIQQQGENAQILAEQRAQYALQQLQAKTQAEQIKEMMTLGIDPNQPDAYEKYLQANRQKFSTDLNYTKARTNWNNRIASGVGKAGGAGSEGKELQYPLGTLKKGKDAKISQLEAQLQELARDPALRRANEDKIKFLQESISKLRDYKPGVNPLTDAEIAELGYQIEEQEMGGGEEQQKGKGQYNFDMLGGNPEQEDEFQWEPLPGQQSAQNIPQQPKSTQNRYANISEPERMKAMNNNAKNVIRNAPLIASINMENPDPKTAQLIVQYAQELVDLGVFDQEAGSPEEAQEMAIEAVIRLAQQNAKQ